MTKFLSSEEKERYELERAWLEKTIESVKRRHVVELAPLEQQLTNVKSRLGVLETHVPYTN